MLWLINEFIIILSSEVKSLFTSKRWFDSIILCSSLFFFAFSQLNWIQRKIAMIAALYCIYRMYRIFDHDNNYFMSDLDGNNFFKSKWAFEKTVNRTRKQNNEKYLNLKVFWFNGKHVYFVLLAFRLNKYFEAVMMMMMIMTLMTKCMKINFMQTKIVLMWFDFVFKKRKM